MIRKRSEFIKNINSVLPLVQKPGRYVGGEFNQVFKNWDQIDVKIALVFPDVYEIGLSNLGLAILYEIINNREDALAERVYSPWLDMEERMRERKIPLFSLESMHSLSDFDIIGISIPYESLYTNVLNILDLAGIPIKSDERNLNLPLVIAGGNSTFNPEPMHQFIDAFVIGDGETAIGKIIDLVKEWKKDKTSKLILLENFAQLEGIYVPKFYDVTYSPDNTINQFAVKESKYPSSIKRNMIAPLPPAPVRFLVPNIDTTHNRISIEIMRGCTRGCRFCQAGMINRPVRQRSVQEIVASVKTSVKNTGFEEISLLSLSSSDYTQLSELISALSLEFSSLHLTISLPSLRIDTFSVEHMDRLQGNRHGSFTFAPEAASDHLRNRINKPISTEQLFSVAREVFRHHWQTIKLYFMIGFPGETIEDVQAICSLCRSVLAIGTEEIGNRASIHVSVNTFIPKPHTPFQWVSQEGQESLIEKQNLLRSQLKHKRIKLNWSDNDTALLEAALSRGDRRLSAVIFDAWKEGAKFDAWHEQFKWQIWENSFEKNGIDPAFYALRERNALETFPWDHINTGVRKEILLQEYQMSNDGITRPDCRERCYGCGIQAYYSYLCRTNQPFQTNE